MCLVGSRLGCNSSPITASRGMSLAYSSSDCCCYFGLARGTRLKGASSKSNWVSFNSKVKIADITKLRAAKYPLSAPALAIDRIEILYGKYGIALISPKNRVQFIKMLLAESPGIGVDGALYT